MSTVHGIVCNGCSRQITRTRETGESRPSKQAMEQAARNEGWQAPDKMGRHWCGYCRLTPKPKRRT